MKTTCVLVFVLLMLGPVSGFAARQHIETGPDAEVSFDGLHRVKRSEADAAWVRPDLDLSGYRRLQVTNAGISYRKMKYSGSPEMAARRGETDFPVTERNREKLAQLLQEELLDELGKSERYVLTDETGEDVLVLVVGLFDVVSHVPPDAGGWNRIYLRSLGEASLVLELRDSLTGAVLARAVDRRAAGGNRVMEANPVTGRAETRRLVDSWGRTIREVLDKVVTIGEGGAFID